MRNSPVGLFEKIADREFHGLLTLRGFEKKYGIRAVKLAIPESTLEKWEEKAGAPIAEIREWPVEGGPFTEIQVTFDNGWIRPLRDIRKEIDGRKLL